VLASGVEINVGGMVVRVGPGAKMGFLNAALSAVKEA
jgi:hypothetical protein